MKNLLLAFFLITTVLALSVSVAPSILAAAPTPSPGAMTIYQVTNPNQVSLYTQHTFYKGTSPTPVYEFFSTVPISSTLSYHVSTMPQITSPFTGSVVISASLPFTAEVTGYDYPSTSTPTVTRTNTPTVTRTVTATATRTATPTATRVVVTLPVIK